MALVQKKNARQNTFLLVLLIVVVIGGIVAYTLFRPGASSTDTTTGGGSSRDPEIFTDFGEDLYNTQQFQSLHDFSKDIPPTETVTVPIPVPNPDIESKIDLPPNTTIGNPEPFKS